MDTTISVVKQHARPRREVPRTRASWCWWPLFWLTLALLFVCAHDAWASTGGRMPLQNFFSELYRAGLSTYLPALALVILVGGVANWYFGWVSMGEMLGKTFLGIALLSLGVGYIVGLVGGTLAEGASQLRVPAITHEVSDDPTL